jgi:regulator of cell morphogenesis and NO signaling
MRTLDVRELVCGQRHALIFGTFDALKVGEGFEFVNDHDPKPLYNQFCQRYANQFRWEYLEQGPDVWRMAISRIQLGEAKNFQMDASLKIDTRENSMKIIDVREITPRERHPLIFNTFDALALDEQFTLVNDHDPKPLYYQFLHERPNQFTWEYLEEGPTVWRVNIGSKSEV